MRYFAALLGRALLLTAGFVVIGVLFNALRTEGIDLVAQRPYEIFVPCPESQAEAGSVTTAEVQARQVTYLDARPTEDYEREHIKGAVSLPYPVLGDPPPERIDELKRRGGPIVTYDSGGRDRLGEMMANLLTELGVEQVTHLEGGLEAFRERGGATEGKAPSKQGSP